MSEIDAPAERNAEPFDLVIFLAGTLAAALLLLVMPVAIIFHPHVLIYAGLLGTASLLGIIVKLTLIPKQ